MDGHIIPVNTVVEHYFNKDGLQKEVIEGNGINRFPEKLTMGDSFSTNDYNYMFVKNRDVYYWEVRTKDKSKKSYGPILESIDGYPVASMAYAFDGCEQMEIAPTIPKTILYMQYAFSECKSLIKTPVIPNGVKNMDFTFMKCENLKTPPVIPESVTVLSGVVYGCLNMDKPMYCHAAAVSDCRSALHGTKIPRIEGRCSDILRTRLLETLLKIKG